jgi:hypothetical protein
VSRVLASNRSRIILAAVVALALVLTLLAFAPTASGGSDDLYVMAEVTGWACFAKGDTLSVYNVRGIYDIDNETAAFATLQGRSGRGVTVQYVRLNATRDAITVVLTKPAAYDVCAAFHLQQMNTFG